MSRVGILTDTSAQFPTGSFPGVELVNIIPLHISLHDQLYQDGQGLRTQDMPVTAWDGLNPKLIPPSVEEFQRMYTYMGRSYTQVIAVLMSSQLNSACENALLAAANLEGRVDVQVVDSQTAAVGLGLLTQAAASAAQAGEDASQIVRYLRGLTPHVYSMFCLPGLTYLHHAGWLGSAQALVGERLSILPLFIMDGGRLVPVQKARSSRHLVDCLHEFVGEFSNTQQISVVQGVPPFEQEVRALRERFSIDFDSIPVSEHTIGLPMAVLLGPRSLGIFVMEGEV
jgi:fatty acid kinase fatty acid binding subunit